MKSVGSLCALFLASSRSSRDADFAGVLVPKADVSAVAEPPADGLRHLFGASCAKQHSQSQDAEDIKLLPGLLALAGPRPGTFVEIGALDGVWYSNTLMLERCHNWTGLLIEANPDNQDRLRRNLAAGSRDASKAMAEYSAVCAQDAGFVNMTVGGGAVAGVVDTLTEKHIHRWGHNGEHNTTGHIHFDETKTVAVPCRPMSHMLAYAGLQRRATFLSLDVEGAEEVVAKTFDPATFDLILVEMDGASYGPESADALKDRRVDELFKRAGMRHQMRIGLNDVYVRSDVESRFQAAMPAAMLEAQQQATRS